MNLAEKLGIRGKIILKEVTQGQKDKHEMFTNKCGF